MIPIRFTVPKPIGTATIQRQILDQLQSKGLTLSGEASDQAEGFCSLHTPFASVVLDLNNLVVTKPFKVSLKDFYFSGEDPVYQVTRVNQQELHTDHLVLNSSDTHASIKQGVSLFGDISQKLGAAFAECQVIASLMSKKEFKQPDLHITPLFYFKQPEKSQEVTIHIGMDNPFVDCSDRKTALIQSVGVYAPAEETASLFASGLRTEAVRYLSTDRSADSQREIRTAIAQALLQK
jgi:hypothetical protein